MNFVPLAALVSIAACAHRVLPDWRGAKFLRDPRQPMWSAIHFFDDSRWTEEGLRLRARYLRWCATAIVVAICARIVIGSS
jgi:hypothetical protein